MEDSEKSVRISCSSKVLRMLVLIYTVCDAAVVIQVCVESGRHFGGLSQPLTLIAKIVDVQAHLCENLRVCWLGTGGLD